MTRRRRVCRSVGVLHNTYVRDVTAAKKTEVQGSNPDRGHSIIIDTRKRILNFQQQKTGVFPTKFGFFYKWALLFLKIIRFPT